VRPDEEVIAEPEQQPAPPRGKLGFLIWGVRWLDFPIFTSFATIGALLAINSWSRTNSGPNLGLDSVAWPKLVRFLLFTLCNYVFAIHVYTYNDWSDGALNPDEPRRRPRHALKHPVLSTREVLAISAIMGAIALTGYALLSLRLLFMAAFLTVITVTYSHPWINLKGQPIVSTVIHFLGAWCYFLMGWIAFADLNSTGLSLGAFFGLTLAAGHFANEIEDFDNDLTAGIRTNTIAFGQRLMFRIGLILFLASASFFVCLTLWDQVLTPAPVFQFIAFALLYFWLWKSWEYRKWKGGDTIVGFRHSYRLAYATVCAALILIKLLQWSTFEARKFILPF
jgi:4-hydroxybenzoate polyprenyltransferase